MFHAIFAVQCLPKRALALTQMKHCSLYKNICVHKSLNQWTINSTLLNTAALKVIFDNILTHRFRLKLDRSKIPIKLALVGRDASARATTK